MGGLGLTRMPTLLLGHSHLWLSQAAEPRASARLLGSSSEAGGGEVPGERLGRRLCPEAELRAEGITVSPHRGCSVPLLPQQSCDLPALATLPDIASPTAEGEDKNQRRPLCLAAVFELTNLTEA